MKGAAFIDESGRQQPYYMGCYGIGLGRTMAVVVEHYHDERGIVWPEAVAPYRAHLIEIRSVMQKVKSQAETLYKKLLARRVEVLYDDRDEKSAGEKFADADLIGIPWRAVISEKTIAKKGVEVKRRSEEKSSVVSVEKLLKMVTTK